MQEILKDMLKETSTVGQGGKAFTFYQYVDKSVICKKIIDDLINKKYSRKQNRKGFFMAENERNKIGVISHCLGLESISLSSGFNCDLISDDEKKNQEIMAIIVDTVSAIFTALDITQEKVDLILSGKGKDVSLVYEAAPYVFNEDIEDEQVKLTSYVDTIAKVLETFSEFRLFVNNLKDTHNLDVVVEGVDDVSRWNRAVIIKAIQDLNQACIEQEQEIPYLIDKQELKDKFGYGMLYKGWNYKKMSADAEPSLFFTYTACSAYMSLCSNMQATFNALRVEEQEMSASEKAKKVIPTLEFENNKTMQRDYEFIKLFYADYVDFNKRCVDAGHYVDYMIKAHKVDITQDFLGQAYSQVTTDEIINSTTNDAMINTVLAIMIMIYAGVDLDYDGVQKGADFNDQLQYAVQNIMKVYKKLERSSKSYIVDQLTLNFNEEIPAEHQEQVKLLRKQRILAVTLMPLLIKAYTAMSRYIIEYPQKEMSDYLKIILENRCIDKSSGSTMWFWDKDGYNISVNLLYILNMLSFYAYYEKYEYPFTNDTDSFNVRLEKQDELNKQDILEIKTNYQDQIAELKSSLSKAQDLAKELRPIEKEVVSIVNEYLNKNLGGLIAKVFKDSRTATIDKGQDDITKAFKGLFVSLFASKELRDLSDSGMSTEEGKWSTNPSYIENEKILFELFSQWALERLISQK